MQKRLLIVDDEPAIIKGLKFSLEQDGYLIEEAMTGKKLWISFHHRNLIW